MAYPIHDQSSLELLDKLDEQLKECTPVEECPGEQGHGADYAVRFEEIRKVSRKLNNMSVEEANPPPSPPTHPAHTPLPHIRHLWHSKINDLNHN